MRVRARGRLGARTTVGSGRKVRPVAAARLLALVAVARPSRVVLSAVASSATAPPTTATARAFAALACRALFAAGITFTGSRPVSYTHLDVYKRQRYLNAGGLGILVGDGKLPHPGSERIAETYYRLAVFSQAQLSLDYQWVKNPAYNTDRGPVSIFAVRVHAQF